MDGGTWWAAVHGVARVGHDWATSLSLFTFMHWRRKWQPTPVFLPGESQGWGSLVGCRLWGCTESDTTEATYLSIFNIIYQLMWKYRVLNTWCPKLVSNLCCPPLSAQSTNLKKEAESLSLDMTLKSDRCSSEHGLWPCDLHQVLMPFKTTVSLPVFCYC